MAKYDDPRILRAIAHPARNRILSELWASGSLRAADVARLLDIPANQASFHLRQLAKYGLVEEAVGAGRDKRDRVWKLVDEAGLNLEMGELEKAPGGKAAVSVFRRQVAADAHAAVDRAYGREHEEGIHIMAADYPLRLSKKEAEAFSTDLAEVADRWRLRGHEPGEGRRLYQLLMFLQPAAEIET